MGAPESIRFQHQYSMRRNGKEQCHFRSNGIFLVHSPTFGMWCCRLLIVQKAAVKIQRLACFGPVSNFAPLPLPSPPEPRPVSAASAHSTFLSPADLNEGCI